MVKNTKAMAERFVVGDKVLIPVRPCPPKAAQLLQVCVVEKILKKSVLVLCEQKSIWIRKEDIVEKITD